MKALNILLILVIAVVVAHAQNPSRAFEVASVKKNTTRSGSGIGGMVRGDRFIATNVTLNQLLRTAYSVQEFQIDGQPGWADSDRYDIEGKMEQGSKPEDWQPMLQTLLAERFRLALHREQRQATMYSLVVAKNGPKLTPADRSKCLNPAPSPTGGCGMSASPTQIVGTSVSMAQLATRLSRSIGVMVTDKTGLDGLFDFTLEWPREDPFTAPGASANAAIYVALQEQLGLRLESVRGPVETLVIDRAEKPTEN